MPEAFYHRADVGSSCDPPARYRGGFPPFLRRLHHGLADARTVPLSAATSVANILSSNAASLSLDASLLHAMPRLSESFVRPIKGSSTHSGTQSETRPTQNCEPTRQNLFTEGDEGEKIRLYSRRGDEYDEAWDRERAASSAYGVLAQLEHDGRFLSHQRPESSARRGCLRANIPYRVTSVCGSMTTSQIKHALAYARMYRQS